MVLSRMSQLSEFSESRGLLTQIVLVKFIAGNELGLCFTFLEMSLDFLVRCKLIQDTNVLNLHSGCKKISIQIFINFTKSCTLQQIS